VKALVVTGKSLFAASAKSTFYFTMAEMKRRLVSRIGLMSAMAGFTSGRIVSF
jgi:hypothetical protein